MTKVGAGGRGLEGQWISLARGWMTTPSLFPAQTSWQRQHQQWARVAVTSGLWATRPWRSHRQWRHRTGAIYLFLLFPEAGVVTQLSFLKPFSEAVVVTHPPLGMSFLEAVISTVSIEND